MWTTWTSILMAVAAPAASDSTTAVRCAEIAFSDAAESRDKVAFARFLHPDTRFLANRVNRGPAAVVDAWDSYFKPEGPTIRWRPETVELTEAGDLAISRGPYRVVSVGKDGKPAESWGTFVSVWRLGDDGQWRVQFDTGADHGMTPSDELRALLENDPDKAKCESSGQD